MCLERKTTNLKSTALLYSSIWCIILKVFFLSFVVSRLEKKIDQAKYADIIMDFSYFKISAAQEKKIEDDSVNMNDIDRSLSEEN